MYWIDARTHIFESQVLLFSFFFFCIVKQGVSSERESLKNTHTKHPDSPPFFSFFRVGMLFRNFALEPIRLPKFLCLGFLQRGLQAFDVPSLLGKVAMSFIVAADWLCSSLVMAFATQECRRVPQSVVTSAAGWRVLRQRRGHGTCRYLLVSYSLCQVCYCLRILRNN